jgi:hypothetical protein
MFADSELSTKVGSFYTKVVSDPHHRYRSWEHCYGFFKSRTPQVLAAEKDAAALHLGFYLASWGMYRGSAFLLQRAYTVHVGVINALLLPQFSRLWVTEIGVDPPDAELVDTILALVDAVKVAYLPFGAASDTLATKVILGTVASLPAVDRFFVNGFRRTGRQYSRLNRRFVERIIQFSNENSATLRAEQSRIETAGNVYYPLMKLTDMYFWQVGFDASSINVRQAEGFK